MAGDWIKIERNTPDKPEVIRMSTALKLDPDAVTGKLVRLWSWADQNSVDGASMTVTEAFINRLTGHKKFAAALRLVGWLTGEDGALTFPNFLRHNGSSAKARALDTRNKQQSRQNADKTGTDVPPAAGQNPDQRREEKSTQPPLKAPPAGSPPACPARGGAEPAPFTATLHAVAAMQERINALQPAWTQTPHWSEREVQALTQAWPNLIRLQPQDWAVLGWLFLSRTEKKLQQAQEPHQVTSKRQALLRNLTSYLSRAQRLWEKHGKPKAKAPARPHQGRGQEEQELPLGENDRPEGGAAAAARLKALIAAPPTVPTKP